MVLAPSPAAVLAHLLGTDVDGAETALDELVLDACGRRPDPTATVVESLPVSTVSPATDGVHRIRGLDLDGRPWSLFCKALRHARHWPMLTQLPPEFATHFTETFPWRSELELWDPRVQASLPEGLRSPVLHLLIELPDDKLAIWHEDVLQRPHVWDDDTYARAARLLGRWNARSTHPDVLAVSELPPGYGLRMYAGNAVAGRGLPPLADEDLWGHPWLAPHRDLADRLLDLGSQIPDLLDSLDSFPQALPHGDASPQNLLVPAAGDSAEFVAIDVSFRSAHALGFDLGQLMVGLIHDDAVPASRLPGIGAAIVPAYVAGLAEEGVVEKERDIRLAFATAVLLRSGFDAFHYEQLDTAPAGEPPSASFVQRVQLSRFLVTQYDDACRG
jgi:hypothetical protein